VAPAPSKPQPAPQGSGPAPAKGDGPETDPAPAGPTAAKPAGPVEGTTPTGAAAGSPSRPAQPDTLPARGQEAIAQTLGGPLRPGEATLDSLPSAKDVAGLDLGLSDGAKSALAEAGYNGRMISDNGKNYAFAFEEEIARSATTLGVPPEELLLMVQAEEAGHASARSRFSKLSASDNEVVGEAVSSRVSPEAQTLTSLNDVLKDSRGGLDPRYDQAVSISKKALGDTLGPDGNADDFVREFGQRRSEGGTAKEALSAAAESYLARIGSTQTAESFVAALQQNTGKAFQSAADDILRRQGAEAPIA
jgi:hypothetical protein